MKAIGKGSLAAWLRTALDVLRVAIVVLAAGLAILAALAAYMYAGGALPNGAGVMAIEGALVDPWHVTTLAFLIAAGTLATAYIVVGRLRRIFATLAAGDPFVPENADHLRVIAIAIAVFEAARIMVTVAASIGIGMTGGETGMTAELSINLVLWFAVLAFIVLAEVFREGARLRREQQLTI